jgi:hypothetical protein
MPTPAPEAQRVRAQALSDSLLVARTAHRKAEHTLACLLAELAQDRLFDPLGHASIEEYAAAVLDLPARQTRDLVRIGRALPNLPRLAAVLRAGALDWTKARELVRVATADTELEWITRARAVTSRVLEAQIAGSVRGDRPPEEGTVRGDAVRMFATRMESVDLDTVRAALAALRARLGASADELDDGALLAILARHYLASADSGDERSISTERYRVVLQFCPSCHDRHLPNPGGPDAAISDTVEAEAACDAEVVEMRPDPKPVGPKQGHATRTIPPAVRRVVLARAGWRCEVPYCRNRLWLDVHHIHQRSDGGGHDPRGLVCLCDGHHRAVHAGDLGVERAENGAIVVSRADGQESIGPAHVGLSTTPPDAHVAAFRSPEAAARPRS